MAASGTNKRFFSGKMALIALGVALLGVALGSYCVMRVADEGRISIAPSPSHGDKATLELNYCAGCRQLGEVDLIEEQWTGQYDKVLRSARGLALSGPMLAAVLSLLERRGQLSP